MKSKKSKKIVSQILLPRQNTDFFGHENVLADVLAAYKHGTIPGGWLISGPKGIGKATFAYRLARFILSNGIESNLSIAPNSPITAKVSAGSHPDILVLEAGSDAESLSGDILVEDARKIGGFLHLTSADTAYRIVIIDSIDDMNVNAANAILKLLEEPPANAVFLLISHAPGRLLPTIRSRCRQIKMHKPNLASALQILQIIVPDLSQDMAETLLHLASGSPGVAYDLYSNKGLEIYEDIIAIILHLPTLDMLAIHKLGDSLSGKANENCWRIFKLLLGKIITDITCQVAFEQAGIVSNNYNKLKLSIAIDPQKLVQIWQDVNNILEDANTLHLMRKAVLVRIFTLFA